METTNLLFDSNIVEHGLDFHLPVLLHRVETLVRCLSKRGTRNFVKKHENSFKCWSIVSVRLPTNCQNKIVNYQQLEIANNRFEPSNNIIKSNDNHENDIHDNTSWNWMIVDPSILNNGNNANNNSNNSSKPNDRMNTLEWGKESLLLVDCCVRYSVLLHNSHTVY